MLALFFSTTKIKFLLLNFKNIILFGPEINNVF